MTLFVVVITVVIAGATVYFALFGPDKSGTATWLDRFSKSKEVLTIFLGLLGTVMGFYYAENRVSTENVKDIAASVKNPGANPTNPLESKAFESLLKQDLDAAIKAFDDAYKATPPSSNIANITTIKKYLTDNKSGFESGDKKAAWKSLYCLISNGKMAVGMSKEIIDQFDSGCNQIPPANTNTTFNEMASPTATMTTANKSGNTITNTNR
ncbi:MAG: hypothetical protein ABL999_20660 [Pyrinomonadaceae bacterium]